jgi:hypothetical protein
MEEYDPREYPTDYTHPNALAGKFEWIDERLEEFEGRLEELEKDVKHSTQDRGGYAWGFGSILAMILSWSRNASILYCVGHGIASWIYVIYFALTR